MFDKYTAKPWHFLFPILLFSVGVLLMLSMVEALVIISAAFYLGSFGSYVVILVNGTVTSYENYWKEITYFAKIMKDNRNPDLWKALGFDLPEQKTITRTIETDEGQYLMEREVFPVSSDVLQRIAIGVLREGKTFSEGEWVNNQKLLSSGKFRKLQKSLESSKRIKLNNPANTRMGFSFTKRGVALLEQWEAGKDRHSDNAPSLPVSTP